LKNNVNKNQGTKFVRKTEYKEKNNGDTRRWKDNIRMDIGIMRFNNKYLLML